MGTKKQDVYPPKYYSAARFPDTPMVLQIEVVRLEKLQSGHAATPPSTVMNSRRLMCSPQADA